MRVLMISKALVAKAYHQKLVELVNRGIELHLVVPPAWGNQALEVPTAEQYDIHVRQVLFSGKNHFHVYRRLVDLFKNIAPDIVHIDEEHYSAVTFQCMRLARSKGVKSLFFTWQNIYKRYPIPFSLMERYALKYADAAIAGNEEAAQVLRMKGFEKSVHVIPQFGVDPDVFRREDMRSFRRELGLRNASFVVGFVGRFVNEKGISYLLEAGSRLKGDVRILLLGDGPLRWRLKEEIRARGLDGRVLIINSVTSTEVSRYLNCLDCLVLPSLTRPNWKEQFGRVLVEAMACEIPVIGSSSGEIPNVIGDAGLLFEEGNTRELVARLMLLMDNVSLRTELSRKGRDRVLEHFTHERIAEETVRVYERLAVG